MTEQKTAWVPDGTLEPKDLPRAWLWAAPYIKQQPSLVQSLRSGLSYTYPKAPREVMTQKYPVGSDGGKSRHREEVWEEPSEPERRASRES